MSFSTIVGITHNAQITNGISHREEVFPQRGKAKPEDNPGVGVNRTREQQNPNLQGGWEWARTQGPALRRPTQEGLSIPRKTRKGI